MKFPENLKYTKDHEWFDPQSGKIGISDFAQDQLGDVVYLDFAVEEGDTVAAGDVLGTIESVKTVSDIYAPISGTVTALNQGIDAGPEVVNQDPYGDGWLFQIEASNADEVNGLFDAAAYGAQVDAS